MSTTATNQDSSATDHQWEERRRALRTKLQHNLLHASQDSEVFVLIRRHRDWLRQWFTEYPGWSLHVDAELARLRPTPSRLLAIDDSHPARDPKQKVPFTRRRYTCLSLCLASLEKAGRQITLGRMAEDILAMIHNDDVLSTSEITLDLDQRSDRGDLVAISRRLVSLRILERISGDEESYLKQGQGDRDRSDCLYTIHRDVLARLLSVQVGPSMVFEEDFEQRLLALQQESCGQSDAERRREVRRHLIRALLTRPVVYYAELPEDAATYLRHQQTQLVAELCHVTGLIPEQRKEGVALVDDTGEMSDFKLPQEGTDGHAALLLCELLSTALKDHRKAVPHSEVEAFLAEQAQRKGKLWRQDAQTAEGTRSLCHQILDRLEALDLLRQRPEGIEPLPAIARYALREDEKQNQPTSVPAPEPEPNIFDLFQ